MKTIIFSIGAIGRLFYRKYRDNSEYEIIGFIDNNPALKGTFYDKHPIYSVQDLVSLNYDKVLIGGVHYEAMEKQLKSLDIPSEKIEMIKDTDISYADDIRSEKSDNLIKLFCEIIEKEEIKYYLIASSLLSLLRGHNLSRVSDIDIMLDSKKDLEKVYNIFKKYEKQEGITVTKYLSDKKTNFLNVGDFSLVTIEADSDPLISEPAVIDVNIVFKSERHRFYRLGDKYIHFKKEYFDNIKYLDYKGIQVAVPYEYEKYLAETYGKNYIIQPDKWSETDFITLVTEGELLEVIK